MLPDNLDDESTARPDMSATGSHANPCGSTGTFMQGTFMHLFDESATWNSLTSRSSGSSSVITTGQYAFTTPLPENQVHIVTYQRHVFNSQNCSNLQSGSIPAGELGRTLF